MTNKPGFDVMSSHQVEERARAISDVFAQAFESIAGDLDNLTPLNAISVYAAMRIVNEYVRIGLGDEGFAEVEHAFNVVFSIGLLDGTIRLTTNSEEEIAARLGPDDGHLIVHAGDPRKVN